MKLVCPNFWNQLKWHGLWQAFKWLFTGVRSFDTSYPANFWEFKKGEQFDYTNARIVFPEPDKDPHNGWSFGLAPVKPEGAPIAYDYIKWEGEVKLGDWWSIQFKTRWFVIRFRYRSWTKNIFYIAWE